MLSEHYLASFNSKKADEVKSVEKEPPEDPRPEAVTAPAPYIRERGRERASEYVVGPAVAPLVFCFWAAGADGSGIKSRGLNWLGHAVSSEQFPHSLTVSFTRFDPRL